MKTWLTAIYVCTRAILYPETKIIIASGNKAQSAEVIKKIDDLRKNSPNLNREISNIKPDAIDAKVEFCNGSWCRTVASNQGARSARANLLIVDEFRMVDLDIINKVLRKFLSSPRHPKYLDKPEYSHLQERNKEIYLSSAWYKFHWSWNKLKSFFSSMVKGKKYFVCGLPYQLPMKENLLMREQVMDEMSEADFDEIGWQIEMECIFFGESEKSYFKFDDLTDNRVIPKAIYPKEYYKNIKDKNFKYIPKKDNEIRLISCDIAGMAGKQNDASVYTIMCLTPKGKEYERKVVYMENLVGALVTTQAIRIRQLFDDFECDYLVIDTQSYGLGIYDLLTTELYDKERCIEYKPWTCINNQEMADRCVFIDAEPKIYSIKANATLNSECAISLKNNLRQKKIKLLFNENDAKDVITKMKGYNELDGDTQGKLLLPYIQTTSLINEMVNLENEGKDGIIKLREKSGMRKDRFSSLSYANYIANSLERELLLEEKSDFDFVFTYS